MEFSKFSKQKFGENQNKTTLIGAVTGLQGMELSDAHQRAQERAASTQQDGLWDILRNSFLDKSSNDQVVDSFTGQVIQVDKPAAIGGTVKGAGKSAGAYYTNLGGSLIEGLGHLNTSIASKQDAAQISELRKANAQYQQMLDSGKKLDGTPLTEQERQSFANIISRNEWMIGEIPACRIVSISLCIIVVCPIRSIGFNSSMCADRPAARMIAPVFPSAIHIPFSIILTFF